MSIVLGEKLLPDIHIKSQEGDVEVDLKELVRTRLLIFAGSGYGKSWLIRRLLEQSYKLIHQIVLDREGDFYTMRKVYPYLLASANREIKPDIILNVDMAERLARTTMEMRASIIVDLSSLEPDKRVEFVDRFVKTLLNLPKSLRHHALVVIDEIQEFADERETISSTKTLKLFAEQSRKRGLCPIYATQRIAEVNKTCISQCHNRLIGGASLDIDVARATTAAGFQSKRRTEIEELQTGEFFARGPAISKKAVKVKIGPVETPHPEVGVEIEPPVPVTDEKMQRALAALRGKDKEEVRRDVPDFPELPVSRKDVEPILKEAAEKIEKLEEEAKELKHSLEIHVEAVEEKNKYIIEQGQVIKGQQEQLSKFLQLKIAMREVLDIPADIDATMSEINGIIGGFNEGKDAVKELTINADQARVTIIKTVVTNPPFKDTDVEFMLIDLITDGELDSPMSVKDIYNLVQIRYNVDKNYDRFYKNRLWPAMTILSKYPYNYLEKDGAVWKVSKQGKQYLAKRIVAT